MSLRLLSRSVLTLLLILTMSGSTQAAFNFSDVQEVKDNRLSRGDSLTGLGEAEGTGFYLTIYEDVVRNPNRRVEEEIKERFGVDFEVDLSPPEQTGKYLFTDFFDDPFGSSLQGISTPTLKSSLQSDCVRIRTKQAEDVTRRWRLLRKRLGERNTAFEKGRIQEGTEDEDQELTILNRELVQRLIGQVEEASQAALDAAIDDIPEYQNLTNQDALIRCYQDFSREVSYELRIQSLLHPIKQQMEVLSTFMNGRLDDFTDQNAIYGSSFPQYDLLFDIDVIDYIVFGSPVQPVEVLSGGAGSLPVGGGRFTSYADIERVSQPQPAGGSDGDGSTTGPGGGDSSDDGGLVDGSGPDGEGFGTSTGNFAGAFCVADLDGVDLDLTDASDREEALDESIVIPEQPGGVSDVVSDPVVPDAAVESDGEGDDTDLSGLNDDGEGKFQAGPNLAIACEGTAGVDFGNDFLKLLFCINIGFEKTGKSWNAVREDDCIACHMYRMNELFEESILASSVRPHKNTGTIMESAICEDGYGDDVGFHFFLEWAPVKLFPSICYPEGGDGNDEEARQEYAEMVGYPEILSRVDRPNLSVICQADYKREEDIKRCETAIQGTQIEYEQVRSAFMSDVAAGITDVDDVDRDSNVWARLAGDHGIAQRELYYLQYRLGQAPPQFEIDDTLQQDFKIRADALQRRLEAIQKDPALIVDATRDEKLEQYLCLRGFALADLQGRNPNLNCDTDGDTYAKLEADIVKERNRVLRIVERWNRQSQDFNGQNQCQTFQGSGPVDAFLRTFEDKFDPGYYLETDYRKTQNTSQQLTGQIASNSDIADFESLFSTINQEVSAVAQAQRRQEQQESFETDQQTSLALFAALQTELQRFNSNFQAYTNWWSEMVDDKQFVSKGGERINVLESFFEKLQ